ncbi:FixH family protein [Labrenzia sp. PHM005]|uniref:FixH family protein n=1 Tax=Labrenzia sp. PHM005 TaxID=2590016 RepID=UPI00113FEEC5|nr:FixH family protein [Labrenzia sp. PHM005]QDG78782.1 FixH family protein [Labrenzia sp. PHM005]
MAMAEMNAKEPKPFTGKTVLAWLFGFFGVIFAANAVFLYLAFGSFPGVVVESSYKAGQSYNQEIAAARAQEELNWQISSEVVKRDGTGGQLVVTAADANNNPLYGIDLRATLKHPAQGNADIELSLTADGVGRYIAKMEKLPVGSWNLILEIDQDGTRKFKSENRVFVKD